MCVIVPKHSNCFQVLALNKRPHESLGIFHPEVEKDNNSALIPKLALFEAFGSCHEGMFCLKRPPHIAVGFFSIPIDRKQLQQF
jgi:hypothetical protein